MVPTVEPFQNQTTQGDGAQVEMPTGPAAQVDTPEVDTRQRTLSEDHTAEGDAPQPEVPGDCAAQVDLPEADRFEEHPTRGDAPEVEAPQPGGAEDHAAQVRPPGGDAFPVEAPEDPVARDDLFQPPTASETAFPENVTPENRPGCQAPNRKASDGPPAHGAGPPRCEPLAAGTGHSMRSGPVATPPTEEDIYAKLAGVDALVAAGLMSMPQARVMQQTLKMTLDGIQRRQGERAEPPNQQALAEVCIQHPELTPLLAPLLSDEQVGGILQNHAQGCVAGEAPVAADRAAGNGRAAGEHPRESHGRQDGGQSERGPRNAASHGAADDGAADYGAADCAAGDCAAGDCAAGDCAAGDCAATRREPETTETERRP